jgi:hypothetical protein
MSILFSRMKISSRLWEKMDKEVEREKNLMFKVCVINFIEQYTSVFL